MSKCVENPTLLHIRRHSISLAKLGRGAHAVTIGDIPSLEWFQAIPNGKSRLNPGTIYKTGVRLAGRFYKQWIFYALAILSPKFSPFMSDSRPENV